MHISAHLGGGVGRVLLNYLKFEKKNSGNNHIVYCLDYINDNAKGILSKLDISFKELLHTQYIEILNTIKSVDVVLIHYWNHPLLYEFLVTQILPPCRLIMWSHTSGFHAPQIFSKKLLDYPDKFVFTTPMSYLCKEVKKYKDNNKLDYVWSTAGLSYIKDVKKNKHKTFNMGYIGSIDFAKMHPDFVQICSKIDIPNVKFIICGDGCDLDTLKQQVKSLKLDTTFEFYGYVQDIKPYLSLFDLFIYPLSKTHYGTCDQVIAETMACGIVPVVFDNYMENYMVHHLYSGMVAKNEKEFIKYVKLLYKNKSIRQILESNAKIEAIGKFSVGNMKHKWDKIFKEIINLDKCEKKWNNSDNLNINPYEIFLESIGQYSKIFLSNDEKKIKIFLNKSTIWKSNGNGSIKQYQRFFKKDSLLYNWSKLT